MGFGSVYRSIGRNSGSVRGWVEWGCGSGLMRASFHDTIRWADRVRYETDTIGGAVG